MRRQDRKISGKEEICGIISGCRVLRLAMADQGRPYIVPLSFGWSMDGTGRLTLFFHSARAGRKIDILAANPEICFELDLTLGLKPADKACDFGLGYASIIGEGRAEQLTAEEDRLYALNRIMLHHTGRDDFGFSPAALQATAVYRIEVSNYSAKSCPLK